MLVTLTGPQPYVRHPSRVHIEVLRRNLLTVPARLIRHARGIESPCDQNPAASTSPPPSTSCATCQHPSTDRARTPAHPRPERPRRHRPRAGRAATPHPRPPQTIFTAEQDHELLAELGLS